MDFLNADGALVMRRNGETVKIEAWGKNSLRVRATRFPQIIDEAYALTEISTFMLIGVPVS